MRERPILFSGPMVRAILAGTKTQTRRAVKKQPVGEWAAPGRSVCPYGQPGDRLWVRENGWERPKRTSRMMRDGGDTWAPYYYDADGWNEQDHADFKTWGFKRRPSIHMPRSVCRLVLEITGVRVERLQAMTLDDLCEEGIGELLEDPDSVPGRAFSHAEHAAIGGVPMTHIPEMYGFAALWDSLNGAGAWKANPWVWVVEFRAVAARQQQEGASNG